MGTCARGQVDDVQFGRWRTDLLLTSAASKYCDLDLRSPKSSARWTAEEQFLIPADDLESCQSEFATEGHCSKFVGRDESRSTCSYSVCEYSDAELTEPVVKEARALPDYLLDCPITAGEARRVHEWNGLDEPGLETLRKGGAVTFFSCRGGNLLSEMERGVIRVVLDCARQSPINTSCATEFEKYTFLTTKTCFVVPRIDFTMMTPTLIASMGYQEKVCGTAMTVSPVPGHPESLICNRTVIPWVHYDITQYAVLDVPADTLPSLAPLVDDVRIDRAIILVDETPGRTGHHVRSIQMYHFLGNGRGAVFWCITIVARTSLPAFIGATIESFGSSVADEMVELGQLVRKYWADQTKFSDS